MGKVVKKIGLGLLVAAGVFATLGLGSVALVIGSTTIGTIGVSTLAAVGIGLQAVGSMLSRGGLPGAGELWGRLQLKTDPGAPRWVLYGKAATAGTLIYRETRGTNNNTLWMVIALAGHEITSIVSFKWGGEAVSFSSGAATGTYAGLMYRYDKLGTDGQTVETNLDSASTKWTSNHRGRGIAYKVLKLVFDEETLNQVKTPLFVCRGRKLYDPRLDSTNGGSGSQRYDDHSTWAWSENPALCIADYLMGIRVANSATNSYDGQIIAGMGVDPARIDWTSVAAAANACEESVSLNGGGSEDRYTCNGFVDPRRAHRENLAQLASAMGGQVVFQYGRWSVYAAVPKTAVKARNETHLIGGLSYRAKASRSEKANAVRGVFADADADFAPKDYPPLINSTYVAEDGGDELWLDLNLPMTTSGTMAQRLAKISLERSRRDGRVSVSLQPVGLQDKAMDAVLLSYAPFNLSSSKMLVADWSLVVANDDDGKPGIVVKETLIGEDDAIYAWSAASDEQSVPGPVKADRPTRIADQRLLPAVGSGGGLVAVAATPLTASDAGASASISVAAHSYQYGWGSVSVNAGSITGLAFGTQYFVYFDDPNFEGGAVTYVATTVDTNVTAAQGRIFVGKISTPADGGGTTGGTGGGGLVRL